MMRYIIIAFVLLSLTGCMLLFETVEEVIDFRVRLDNQTGYDLVAKISDVEITQGPGISPYFDGTALDIGGEGYATGYVYVSVVGMDLVKRTTVRVSSGGLYTLTVQDNLGYQFIWTRD